MSSNPSPRAAGHISFQQLADAMPQMVWSTLPDGHHDYYNAQWYSYTGVPEGSTDGEGWNGMFHPDDQERAWKRWRHSLATGELYEIEYRLRHHSGEYRWTLGRALPIRNEAGAIVRWVGTCTNIDEQKRIAEHNSVLSRELSHRIKNIFAVVNALISLSAREFAEARTFSQKLRARIAALGRAHDYVRPHSEDSAPQEGPSTLHSLLAKVLSPYPALEEGRLTIEGVDQIVDDRSATPIGMVFHELATNASKYGALSVPEGRVQITSSEISKHLVLTWKEEDGPPIVRSPVLSGFGSRLTEISVIQQLNGKLERDWAPSGLQVRIEFPLSSIHRS
ncbi:sensor histidine kinase [Sphingomonas sp. GCM10030256]|uniref:sensor histidine kinase n=1 Tax=Sphingomonas sp. GCM10030256 TaxID=3273427 RepID=UPI003612C860